MFPMPSLWVPRQTAAMPLFPGTDSGFSNPLVANTWFSPSHCIHATLAAFARVFFCCCLLFVCVGLFSSFAPPFLSELPVVLPASLAFVEQVVLLFSIAATALFASQFPCCTLLCLFSLNQHMVVSLDLSRYAIFDPLSALPQPSPFVWSSWFPSTEHSTT